MLSKKGTAIVHCSVAHSIRCLAYSIEGVHTQLSTRRLETGEAICQRIGRQADSCLPQVVKLPPTTCTLRFSTAALCLTF